MFLPFCLLLFAAMTGLPKEYVDCTVATEKRKTDKTAMNYGHENETSNGGRGGFVRKSLRTKENERYSEHKAGKTKRARS